VKFSLDKHLKKLNGWRPMEQPVGKGLAYGVAFGVTSGLSGLVRRIFDPGTAPFGSAITLLVASIIVKTKFIRDKIGSEVSELLAGAAWIGIIQEVLPMVTSLGRMPFELLGARPAPMKTVTVQDLVVAEQQKAMSNWWANIPILGPAVASLSALSTISSTPVAVSSDTANEEGLFGLGAAPLLLTSAEEKIASIAL